MIRLIQRLKYKQPKTHNSVWYNCSVHMSDRKYPIVFDENDNYIDCEIGKLVVMDEFENDKKAYYKITDIKSRYGDFIYPSDGIRCNMKFHSIS